MSKGFQYTIATIALPVIGFMSTGMSFALLFAGGGGSLAMMVIVLLLTVSFSVGYFAVKSLNLAWWFPAILLAAPGSIWFGFEMLSPNTKPYILLLPTFVVLLIGLVSGRLGYKKTLSHHLENE